jgi:predicted nucleotidyltransferase component of viral defense system
VIYCHFVPGIPLAERLKKRAHVSVAVAQDAMVSEAYDAFPDCVLHGGTAIWRCYGGGRFSDDVDIYLPRFNDSSARSFRSGLAAKGMDELKFKSSGTTVFAKFSLGGAPVSFEGALREPPARVTMPYDLVGGGYMLVVTLPPESLVAEKAEAYVARRKVRDLYDIFFLLNRVEDRRKAARSLEGLLRGYEEPVDEPQLKATVLAGAVPSADEMIGGVRSWVRRST